MRMLDGLFEFLLVFLIFMFVDFILSVSFMLIAHVSGFINMNSPAPVWWIWGLPLFVFGLPIVPATIAAWKSS